MSLLKEVLHAHPVYFAIAQPRNVQLLEVTTGLHKRAKYFDKQSSPSLALRVRTANLRLSAVDVPRLTRSRAKSSPHIPEHYGLQQRTLGIASLPQGTKKNYCS